ncbi:MAG: lipooligosaccharide transport system permease protein [bacterium]|jgi:lipooligosaccharide transport system permease protein
MFFNYQNIKALMVRYYMEYKQLASTLLIGDVMERVIFFIAFGFGLGKAVSEIAGVPYITFIAPGIAAGSGLFVMLAATTYGAHNRYASARIWQSWLATPIKLQDLLFAEVLFPSLRAMPSLLF